MLSDSPNEIVGHADVERAANFTGQDIDVEGSCSHCIKLCVLGRPVKPGDDSSAYPAGSGGIGSAVTDLIFSIAKREVTFFKLTAPISFL